MWASGTVEAPGYLVVGVAAVRSTRLLDSKKVQGRSGELCLVQLEHRYQQFGEEQLVEEQTLVYRKAGAAIPLPVGDLRPEVSRAQWREDHTLDSPTLFRFSAVTFNSHRIHYDQPYATSIEGYPALVVHGPLTALLVAEAIRTKAGRPLDRFEFRASAPLFVDLPFAIVGTSGEAPEAHVVRNDGLEAMHVMARLMPR
jgi:hydroxyacyl-ACP dehydratase HTD2-like protein with hotdog domain